MNKQITVLIITVMVLIIGFLIFYTKPLNHKNNSLPIDLNDKNSAVEIRDMSQVPEQYYSGNSRYSHGECSQDKDCSITGCSSEMCTNDPNIMTTCEILGDTPDKEKYACGCIKDKCGWYPLR